MKYALSAALFLLVSGHSMAIDLDDLWDFQNPELSEQRFTKALDGASSDDRLILQTQIARTLGLRGNYDAARTLLVELDQDMLNA